MEIEPANAIVENVDEVDPVLDELQITFDALEEAEGITNLALEYEKILKNERVDEVALKIKEACIYK